MFFFFNDTATTEIYTLSLHDALPIYSAFTVSNIITTTGFITADSDRWDPATQVVIVLLMFVGGCAGSTAGGIKVIRDRKSTRLNSSHANISYAVFCLKKKKKNYTSIY